MFLKSIMRIQPGIHITVRNQYLLHGYSFYASVTKWYGRHDVLALSVCKCIWDT